MTATIGPACAPAPGIAPAQPNDSTADTASAPSEGAGADSVSGEHPLAKLAIGDLHRFVQAFAPPGAGHTPTLLAPFHAPPQGGTPTLPGAGIPLYDTQQPGGPGQQLPAPVKPAPPMDTAQLDALNRKVQQYDIGKAPKDEDLRHAMKSAKSHMQDATDALKAGDYKKAEFHLRHLGLPLPRANSGERLTYEGAATAILLGAPAHSGKKTGWNLDHVEWGKNGFQPLIDINGFAANAIMINRLSSLPGGVSNPPTEAQVKQYMRDFANPPKGTPRPTPEQVMRAASDITNGMIIHYSSAGKPNPTYGDNPNPRAAYKGADGKVYDFKSKADAEAAAKAGNPQIGAKEPIETLHARSPDAWSDVASPGHHAGRHVGDCESKVFVQTRALVAAGFTSLGSVDVQHGPNSGHMFGVFKAPDGTIWVTSNEEFRQVKPAMADNGVVTQEHLEYTLRNLTAEVYKVEVDSRGKLEGFTFAYAATANQKGPDAAIDTIRRSSELNMMGRSEPLMPPPTKKP